MNDKRQIHIFVKAPVPGKVKTRLAKKIGNDLAAQFAQQQLNYLFTEFAQNLQLECWIDGDMQHAAFEFCIAENIPRYQQLGENLGEKMVRSMQQGLQRADKVLIIGSDCSGLNNNVINNAFDALDSHSMVFVPAEDGGFVLWGCCQNLMMQDLDAQHLFTGVQWGQGKVWRDTKRNLERNIINFCELDVCWDLDTLEDVFQHWSELPEILTNFLIKNSIQPQ